MVDTGEIWRKEGANQIIKEWIEWLQQKMAQSGWEQLTAMRSDKMAAQYRVQGAKEMERVWHNILKEKYDELTQLTGGRGK